MASIGGGGPRVSIPASARKTIHNIREIAGNHSDDEIYAMLRECSMDPNETAQKLLLQDTFHEVKRKRDRRKEAQISNIPNNREPADFRWRPGPQGRGGGGRGGRGNYPSRYVSRDITGGRNANFGKESEINQVIDKSITPASASVVQDTENNSMTTIPSSATGLANGPRKGGYPISTQECTLQDPAVSCTISVEDSPAPMNKIETPIPNDVIGSASGRIAPTPEQILPTAHQSGPDPVLGTSQVACNPVPVTIKREEWCQQPARDSTIKKVVSARDTTIKKVVSSGVSGSEGLSISGKGFSQTIRSVHGNLPSQFLESEAKQPLDTSQTVSSSHQSNSVGSRPSSSYSSRSQQLGGPQRVTGQIKEWKPKSTNTSPAQASEALGAHDAKGEAVSLSQPASSSTSSEDSTSKLQKKFHNMQFSEAQHVIIPDHLQVPESERTRLSFGSFDALFVPGARFVCDPENDKGSTHLSESSQEVVENVEETCSSDQSPSPTAQEADYPGPHTPEPMPEVSSREHDHSGTSPVPEYESSKSEEALTPGGLPFQVVHAAPTFPNFGILSPVLGSQFTSGEGAEPLSHDSSRLANFVQPFDPSTLYTQIYRPSADASLLPAATKYNGNTVAQPVQTGQSPQEIANSSALSSTVSTTPITQPAGVSQSPLTVSQQLVPVFRQPAGVHLSHFPPNFFPYSQYLSPFYIPPPTFHQFLSNTPYPQQPSAVSMYPPPAVVPGAAPAKYSISQYKPPSNSGNPNPLPAVYGAYSSSPSAYSSVTNGISTGSEDLTSAQYKENNVYINGQQQTEGSTMWIPATGREGSAMQPGSFYNLPQGQPMNFTPTQAGHGAFTGIYHPQPIPGGAVHLLSQAMPGTVEMVAPPAGVYQQPQRAQINWSNNY